MLRRLDNFQSVIDTQEEVYAAEWCPRNTRVAFTQCMDIAIVDTVTGTLVQVLRGHTEFVTCLGWSPEGQRLVSGSEDMTVRVWNVETGQTLQVLSCSLNWISSVGWSPDGTAVIAGVCDEWVQRWNADTGQNIQDSQRHKWGVWRVAQDTDIPRQSSDGTVHPFHLLTAAINNDQYSNGWSPINVVGWSPDGTKMVAGLDDETVRIWDVVTKQEIHKLVGHHFSVTTIAWSPDGSKVASGGSMDKTIRVWDANTGQILHTLEGHTGCVKHVSWSPNGMFLVSASRDQTVRLWKTVAVDETVEIVRSEQVQIVAASQQPTGIQYWVQLLYNTVLGYSMWSMTNNLE